MTWPKDYCCCNTQVGREYIVQVMLGKSPIAQVNLAQKEVSSILKHWEIAWQFLKKGGAARSLLLLWDPWSFALPKESWEWTWIKAGKWQAICTNCVCVMGTCVINM